MIPDLGLIILAIAALCAIYSFVYGAAAAASKNATTTSKAPAVQRS